MTTKPLNKSNVLLLLFSFLFCTESIAGFNPFNKDKNLRFGDSTHWRVNTSGAMKSGMDKHKGNRLYYHLTINNDQLKLQLSKNDPDSQYNTPWNIESLEVHDVNIDGITLPQFTWCLDHRDNPEAFPALATETKVRDNACFVDIRKGHFIIKLDRDNLSAVKRAGNIQIVIKLDKFLTTLDYKMNGFDIAFSKYISTVNATRQKQEKAAQQHNASTTSRSKTCYIKAPDKYSSAIKPVSYVCNDKSQRSKAIKTINSKVAVHKRKQKESQLAMQRQKQLAEERRRKKLEQQRNAEAEQKRLAERKRKEALEQQEREKKWGKIETSMWLDRCKQKWSQGVSPCYCQSYLKELSPKGVTNTCRKP